MLVSLIHTKTFMIDMYNKLNNLDASIFRETLCHYKTQQRSIKFAIDIDKLLPTLDTSECIQIR